MVQSAMRKAQSRRICGVILYAVYIHTNTSHHLFNAKCNVRVCATIAI